MTPAERIRTYRRHKQAESHKVVSKWLPAGEDNDIQRGKIFFEAPLTRIAPEQGQRSANFI